MKRFIKNFNVVQVFMKVIKGIIIYKYVKDFVKVMYVMEFLCDICYKEDR